jgi:hypothetical protein
MNITIPPNTAILLHYIANHENFLVTTAQGIEIRTMLVSDATQKHSAKSVVTPLFLLDDNVMLVSDTVSEIVQ